MLNLDRSTWRRVRFGEVVRNLNESVKDPTAAGIDRVLGLDNLDGGELEITRWGNIADGTTFTRRVRPGQTLFGKRRAYQRKTAYATFDAICSGDILVFESADPNVLLPELLPFLAMTDAFYDNALGTSAGSLSPRTKWSDLAAFEFELPPLDQQRRVADLLWVIERQSRSIAAEMQSLSACSGAWKDEEVKSLALLDGSDLGKARRDGAVAVLTGPFGTALSSKEFVEGAVPVIHPANIRAGRIFPDRKSTVPTEVAERVARWQVAEGDLVLMRKGDVGRSAVVQAHQAGWVLSSDCISLRPNGDVLPEYLRVVLSAPAQQASLLRRAPGTTMPGINEKSLSHLRLPLVRTSVQMQVIGRHAVILSAGEKMAHERDELTKLRASILGVLDG